MQHCGSTQDELNLMKMVCSCTHISCSPLAARHSLLASRATPHAGLAARHTKHAAPSQQAKHVPVPLARRDCPPPHTKGGEGLRRAAHLCVCRALVLAGHKKLAAEFEGQEGLNQIYPKEHEPHGHQNPKLRDERCTQMLVSLVNSVQHNLKRLCVGRIILGCLQWPWRRHKQQRCCMQCSVDQSLFLWRGFTVFDMYV